jgi:hypothetical protein
MVRGSWRPVVRDAPDGAVQFQVRLSAHIYPYGGFVLWLSLGVNFPRGITDSGRIAALVRASDPRAEASTIVIHHRDQALSPADLLNAFGAHLLPRLFPETVWTFQRSQVYGIILLGKMVPAPTDADTPLFATLSTGFASADDLAPGLLESFRVSDYGLFRNDRCHVRRGGIVAYLPSPNAQRSRKARRSRPKRTLHWLARPAEVALLQREIGIAAVNDLQQIHARLLTASLSTKSRVANAMRGSFANPTTLLFLEDLLGLGAHLPAGVRKLYYRIADVVGVPSVSARVHHELSQLVDLSLTWRRPVAKVVESALGIARRITGR